LKKSLLLFILILLSACKSLNKNNSDNFITENNSYDKAWEFYEKQENDSAYVYFNKAYPIFLKQNNNHQAAKCLINMAYISFNKGDIFGSQELNVRAIKLLNPQIKEERETLSSLYNIFGQSNHELGNYKEAIHYYQKAIDFSEDINILIVNQNNIANSYRYNNQFNEAIKIYTDLLKNKQINENPKEYARVLDNLAYTKWLQNKKRTVENDLNKALVIRLKENDLWGQNASFAHLTDYFSEMDKSKALKFANNRITIAFRNNSAEDKLETYQQLILLENAENSKKYFSLYQKLNDSVQFERNKAKNQFALIRYDSEKNKADFLKAEADNEKKKNNILQLYILVAILMFGFVLVFFWIKKRKHKLQQEKILEVKNTELKYSKKVHDKVANRIYQVMSEVENKPTLDRNHLLNKLEDVYEISRDISYENLQEKDDNNFDEELGEMISSYSADEVDLFIIGNDADLWKDLSKDAKSEVFLIVQELLTNMRKHSKASRVVLNFSELNKNIMIKYSDNGVGVSDFKPNNGLNNTGNRISNLNGELIFETENTQGFKVRINFPKTIV
jgi:hypothetical protein